VQYIYTQTVLTEGRLAHPQSILCNLFCTLLANQYGITVVRKSVTLNFLLFFVSLLLKGARGSIVGWDTILQAGRSRVRFQIRSLNFSIELILPPHYGPGVGSASNRNEYQESSWRIKGGRRARLTTSRPSVSRLSRQNVRASTSHNPMGRHGLLQG
jgi:hypothetical protein